MRRCNLCRGTGEVAPYPAGSPQAGADPGASSDECPRCKGEGELS